MRIRVTTSWALAFMSLAAAVFVTSCSDDSSSADEADGDDELTEVILSARMDDSSPATRVGMTKEGTDAVAFFWHKSDEICVQTKVGGGYSTGELWTDADTKTGDVSTNFIGYIYGKLGSYAVYPYNENHRFTSKTAMKYYLLAEYTYETVESKIFSSTKGGSTDGGTAGGTAGTTSYPSNSAQIPTLAAISANKLYFRPIGGVAVIRIDSMPSASGTLKITADQQLSGNFTISDLSATDVELTTTTSTSSTDDKAVTITFNGATEDSVGVFYLPLPTGSYSNFKITISYSSTTQIVNYGDLSIARGDVVAIPLTTNSKGKLWSFQSLGENQYRINGHVFVDLGLPSGLLWAATNVGAETAADGGCYFAWGETDMTTKSLYNWSTYKHGTSFTNLTKYNYDDGRSVLEEEDDAASVNWGTACRMPTNDEFVELLNTAHCNWAWTSQNTSSGSPFLGSQVTSFYNGSSIFLPASGYHNGWGLYNHGVLSFYWSSRASIGSSKYECFSAYCIKIDSGIYKWEYGNRYNGFVVRPVAEK